jgi:NAD(P)-dependent dehydrogenase (short-subunit alcohol dehydrogenase family)
MNISKNPFDLSGQTIAITGAGGLMGRQFAISLAEFGANLALIDVNTESIAKLSEDLKPQFNIKIATFTADITNEEEIRLITKSCIDQFGMINGLINNAARNPKVGSSGLSALGRLETLSIEEWNADLAVGLTGAFLCSKHFGTAMSENSMGGNIVNISSDLGLISPDQRIYGTPGVPAELNAVKPVSYSVVKSGLLGLTRYLATYWPGRVRCNAICPGGIELDQDPEFIEKLSSRIPMGRMAKPDEYGATMVYLMSTASSYLNGAIIPIDGGRTAW